VTARPPTHLADPAAPALAFESSGPHSRPRPGVIACWSAKGGAGTTVVAAALALRLARHPTGALLVDSAGDAPAVLGLPEPDAPGLADWLRSDGRDDLTGVATGPGLAVVSRGTGPLPIDRAEVLARALDRLNRPVVIDCGTVPQGVAAQMAGRADESLLVTRPCYLALRRVVSLPLPRPTGVIVIHEPGRVLSAEDVATAVGAPVVAEINLDPAVARAVDAGLMSARLPRSLDVGLAITLAAFGTPHGAARASSAALAASAPTAESEVAVW
jgi:hypothetical protein